jgi:hypothetical protein
VLSGNQTALRYLMGPKSTSSFNEDSQNRRLRSLILATGPDLPKGMIAS